MAATGVRYYTPNPFEVDANGVPLAGAQLFFYITQTSTPLNTYQDAARGASDRDHHGGRSCDGGRRTHAFARARTG